MARITATPPKDPQQKKAQEAEGKYVNQAAEPNVKPDTRQKKSPRK